MSEEAEAPDPIVLGESQLHEMIADLCSASRTYAVVGIASSLDDAEPAIATSDIRGIVGPDARIYFLQTDELLHGLKTEIGTKLALSRGAARIWWPAVTRRSDPGDHPLVLPLEGESPQHILAEFARQFRLSRPDVRREFQQTDDVRALAEHRQEQAENKGDTTAQRLREAHTERHREAARADTAEAERDHTKRQLEAALGAGGARTDIGVFSLGLDATEKADIMNSFAENLNLLRAKAGLTQHEFAARSFLTPDYIAALGDGTRLPGFLALLSIARALEVSVEDLTSGLASPTREPTRAELRELLAERPRQRGRTAQLVKASRLPHSYVLRTLRYMRAYGEIVSPKRGEWALPDSNPKSRGGRSKQTRAHRFHPPRHGRS